MGRYTVSKWGPWWFGILDTKTKCGHPLMVHQKDGKYISRHPECPNAMKMVLFKTKKEAQDKVDALNNGSIKITDLGWRVLE